MVKIGDRVRILSIKKWSSYFGSHSPINLELPMEGVVKNLVTRVKYLAASILINNIHYGFDMTATEYEILPNIELLLTEYYGD